MTTLRTLTTFVAAVFCLIALQGTGQAGEPVPTTLGLCGPVPGAYQLPGSDACLRLSGFAAADVGTWRTPAVAATGFASASPPVANLGRSAIGADASLSADVQLPTDLGPARLYVSVRARHGGLPMAH